MRFRFSKQWRWKKQDNNLPSSLQWDLELTPPKIDTEQTLATPAWSNFSESDYDRSVYCESDEDETNKDKYDRDTHARCTYNFRPERNLHYSAMEQVDIVKDRDELTLCFAAKSADQQKGLDAIQKRLIPLTRMRLRSKLVVMIHLQVLKSFRQGSSWKLCVMTMGMLPDIRFVSSYMEVFNHTMSSMLHCMHRLHALSSWHSCCWYPYWRINTSARWMFMDVFARHHTKIGQHMDPLAENCRNPLCRWSSLLPSQVSSLGCVTPISCVRNYWLVCLLKSCYVERTMVTAYLLMVPCQILSTLLRLSINISLRINQMSAQLGKVQATFWWLPSIVHADSF